MQKDFKDLQISKTLLALDNAAGVSGDELRVAEILKKEMSGLYDDFYEDALGNQFFTKYGSNPDKKVLIAAHLDEIGFIVNYIDEYGFARILPVGYHDDRVAINQDLIFHTADGKEIFGVTGSKPAHIMTSDDHNKVIKIEDLYVDIGASSAAEARAMGLEIGDYGTFARHGRFLNGTDFYSGKSVDDRAGLVVMVEALKRLKDLKISPTICMAATTQEEVGLRSGEPICNRFNPEQFFAIDVTLAGGGAPGAEDIPIATKLGGGVGFKFYDWDKKITCGNNVARKLTNRMIEVARKYNIAFQREVFVGGGTDAWTAAKSGMGILTGGICIPTRYMHTAVGIVKLSDLETCADFIVKYLQDYQSL
ncbi:MAG: M20/M25/M40 family metallo-hydrolase [Elusimicrobiota bacterium]|jgi:endoglucanase|nr:M20/M25/M40 family metallo-hydrolase [Elusimicrobiota bacterium]